MVENPNLIIPCVRVHRSVLNAARRNGNLAVNLELTWMSGGTVVTRFFSIALSEFERATHDEGEKDTNYVLTETRIDVAEDIDAGSEVSGTATLSERGAAPTAVRVVPGS